MLRCWALVCAWAGTGVPDGRAAGRADGCLRAHHASPTPGSRESRWNSSRQCRLLCVASGEPLRGSWGDGARPAARRRTLGCHDLCEFASGARPARLRRKRREASEQVHGRSFGRGRREGTGAKVVQSAEVCNNCARSFANLILHVDGCQTKLSHFDAVACNTEQCPDRFHARRREPLLHCVRQ